MQWFIADPFKGPWSTFSPAAFQLTGVLHFSWEANHWWLINAHTMDQEICRKEKRGETTEPR